MAKGPKRVVRSSRLVALALLALAGWLSLVLLAAHFTYLLRLERGLIEMVSVFGRSSGGLCENSMGCGLYE